MTARCPLDPLIAVRRLRRDAAMLQVAQQREVVDAAAQRCSLVRTSLQTLRTDRAACLHRLTHGDVVSVEALCRVDERARLLAARASEAEAELMAAERALEAARNELAGRVAEFRTLEARLDALQSRRAAWLRERARQREHREEDTVEEMIVHRIATMR